MEPSIDEPNMPQARQWRGVRLSPVDETLMFHGQAFLQTFRRLVHLLGQERIDYVVVGELAAAAYYCLRATRDIDVCVRQEGLQRFQERLVGAVYEPVEGRRNRFRDRQTQTVFTLRISGELAGRRGTNHGMCFPDPSEAVEVEGIRTIPLERLIVLKLVTRRFKDWADVMALVRANILDQQAANRLPASIRSAYLQCYEQMLEEDRYECELEEH